jgi:hypothetical protein
MPAQSRNRGHRFAASPRYWADKADLGVKYDRTWIDAERKSP